MTLYMERGDSLVKFSMQLATLDVWVRIICAGIGTFIVGARNNIYTTVLIYIFWPAQAFLNNVGTTA